ncbi:MAG: diaminopimelate decarboxylase [Bacteroidales bacterium]
MQTPYYQYDIALLRQTLSIARQESQLHGYYIHYALKANSNPTILRIIAEYGFGADCVSGNEVKTALENGFAPNKIVFAGVGKCDEEIELAIDSEIFCLHCESLQELEVINRIAAEKNRKIAVALRINPNVDALTHKHITTGTSSNKFGLTLNEAKRAIQIIPSLQNIKLIGLHFHIGSQITQMSVFNNLALRAKEIEQELCPNGEFIYLNLGGGLGIDYENPTDNSIPNFKEYFSAIDSSLERSAFQKVHFELGRSLVGQCGKLITKVLFTKQTGEKNFAIVDAGMNTLIRPALYGAHHRIENATSKEILYETYSIVGPICETTDCFDENVYLPVTKRGDIIEILSCGAYGEAMSSRYNLRDLPGTSFTNSDVYCEQTVTV